MHVHVHGVGVVVLHKQSGNQYVYGTVPIPPNTKSSYPRGSSQLVTDCARPVSPSSGTREPRTVGTMSKEPPSSARMAAELCTTRLRRDAAAIPPSDLSFPVACHSMVLIGLACTLGWFAMLSCHVLDDAVLCLPPRILCLLVLALSAMESQGSVERVLLFSRAVVNTFSHQVLLAATFCHADRYTSSD